MSDDSSLDIARLIERSGARDVRTGGVLIVDDGIFERVVLRGMLEGSYQVYEAASAAEAVAMADACPLDVVISNQSLPDATGDELLGRVRERHPELAGILLTAVRPERHVPSAGHPGVFECIEGPWEKTEVVRAVERASEQVEQRRTIAKLVELLARQDQELSSSLEMLEGQREIVLGLQRMSTIGQLASGITHDLRNVMVGLRAAGSEMARDTSSEALRETFAAGMAGVDGLLRTLHSLHDFVRGGALGLQLSTFDADDVVREALAILRVDASFRYRRVEFEPRAPKQRLAADRQKLTQVLLNLLRNAFHATPEGAMVRVEVIRRSAGEIAFTVEDEGEGIPVVMRERLFEPFASTKGGEGLGLGLYMSKLIVDAHRGRISAADRAEGGTRFEVTVPVRPLELWMERPPGLSRAEVSAECEPP